MRRVLSLLGTVLAVYLVLVAALWAFQRTLLYLPDRSPVDPVASGVPEMSVVRLHTADGLTLFAWYRAAEEGRPTIAYLHGNGGHVGYRGDRIQPLLDAGLGLLMVEYRGYGGNPGQPTEQGLQEDARAAMAFLQAHGVSVGRTVLYGESLGGAIAVAIAAEQAAAGRPLAAVVLEAPVSSVTDVAAHHYPWVPVRLLLKDRFEAAARVGSIAAPLLVVHGEADRVVPVRFGRALFAAAVEPKQAVWLDGAGHEDLVQFGLQQIVLDFIRRQQGVPVSRTP
jgi:uncharacterized protein